MFGPGNCGTVYVLLQQIASGRPVMIGNGANRKSMVDVGNAADFLVHALRFGPGVHVCNYVDKPDMRSLLALVQQTFGSNGTMRVAYAVGLVAGITFDLAARLTWRQFPISAVRIRKYAASTQFAVERALRSGFRPAHSLEAALIDTIRHEFAGAAGPGPLGCPSAKLDTRTGRTT